MVREIEAGKMFVCLTLYGVLVVYCGSTRLGLMYTC